MRISIIAFVLSVLLGTPALADTHNCSEQMILQVESRMPYFEEALDVRDLSCNGLAQVYIILTRNTDYSTSRQRQAILAVFRREGLIG